MKVSFEAMELGRFSKHNATFALYARKSKFLTSHLFCNSKALKKKFCCERNFFFQNVGKNSKRTSRHVRIVFTINLANLNYVHNTRGRVAQTCNMRYVLKMHLNLQDIYIYIFDNINSPD